MAIGDVFTVSVRSTLFGQVFMNKLAFVRTLTAEPVQADFTDVANDIKAIHQAMQGTTYAYTTWEAREVWGENVDYPEGADCQPTGGRYFDGNLTAPLNGTSTLDQLPPQCALVTTLRTGQIGRRKRGRYYAAGFGESQHQDGNFNSATITAVTTGWTTFFAEYATTSPVSGFKLGIWSVREATGCAPDPATGEHVRVDPPHPERAFTPCIGFVVRTPVFTQRRRRIGVGM